MIGISKLYLAQIEPSDALRYGRKSANLPSNLLQFAMDKKPVVVWNCTRRCNLNCLHCYSRSDEHIGQDELTTEEGRMLIDQLADFGSPVLLFSGGEPLARPDLPELASYARSKGMRVVISTNGTLIDDKTAIMLKEVGLSYVGISLDGLKATHDHFRGHEGAFEEALAGLRSSRNAGLKVGLRFVINRQNMTQIPEIFKMMIAEDIPRICFYHLVPSGRADALECDLLTAEETRRTVDTIMDHARDLKAAGHELEILTVDNHADGPYLHQRMVREGHPHADQVMELLKMNGGNSSGMGIGCVSWNGDVFPDQFSRELKLGNIREKDFGSIWTDRDNDLLMRFKEKKKYVTGRCHDCKYLDICGGNFRARAEALIGDLWASDPACYLSDKEIGLK